MKTFWKRAEREGKAERKRGVMDIASGRKKKRKRERRERKREDEK